MSPHAPVLYEVEVDVLLDHAEAWATWMREVHIPDVLATGCVASCRWGRVRDAQPAGAVRWTMVYELPSDRFLQTYLRDHAPALRDDHQARFAQVTEARRRIVHVEHSLIAPALGTPKPLPVGPRE